MRCVLSLMRSFYLKVSKLHVKTSLCGVKQSIKKTHKLYFYKFFGNLLLDENNLLDNNELYLYLP